jgi:hypothetical protein
MNEPSLNPGSFPTEREAYLVVLLQHVQKELRAVSDDFHDIERQDDQNRYAAGQGKERTAAAAALIDRVLAQMGALL